MAVEIHVDRGIVVIDNTYVGLRGVLRVASALRAFRGLLCRGSFVKGFRLLCLPLPGVVEGVNIQLVRLGPGRWLGRREPFGIIIAGRGSTERAEAVPRACRIGLTSCRVVRVMRRPSALIFSHLCLVGLGLALQLLQLLRVALFRPKCLLLPLTPRPEAFALSPSALVLVHNRIEADFALASCRPA